MAFSAITVPGNRRVPRLSPSKKGDATRCHKRSLRDTGERAEEDTAELLRFSTGEEEEGDEEEDDAEDDEEDEKEGFVVAAEGRFTTK
jgi:hypothetical protein